MQQVNHTIVFEWKQLENGIGLPREQTDLRNAPAPRITSQPWTVTKKLPLPKFAGYCPTQSVAGGIP